jgi:site-specific recombinase XerD
MLGAILGFAKPASPDSRTLVTASVESLLTVKFIFPQDHVVVMEGSYGGLCKRGGCFDWVLDESKFLSNEEVRRLKKATRKRAQAAQERGMGTPVRDWFLVDLVLSTGLRVQETADLKCGDMFVSDGKSSLVVRRGKGGKPRVVRLGPDFRTHVGEYLEWKRRNSEPTEPESPLLRSSRTGWHMSRRALQRAFKRCAKNAGLSPRYSIHSLRHTYATALLRASNNLRLVQRALGHSSLRVTEVYLGVASTDMDKALRRLYKS